MDRLTGFARAMRRQPTPAEAILWSLLRRETLGLHFRRQHPIGPYIVDFYCASARLVVELDGGGHADPEKLRDDAARDADLRARGLRVLRVWNPDVVARREVVLEEILRIIQS